MSADAITIGTLRKSGGDLTVLFEAVRVGSALGHAISIVQYDQPIPAPEGEERSYDRERRESDSTVIEFLAELGEA